MMYKVLARNECVGTERREKRMSKQTIEKNERKVTYVKRGKKKKTNKEKKQTNKQSQRVKNRKEKRNKVKQKGH